MMSGPPLSPLQLCPSMSTVQNSKSTKTLLSRPPHGGSSAVMVVLASLSWSDRSLLLSSTRPHPRTCAAPPGGASPASCASRTGVMVEGAASSSRAKSGLPSFPFQSGWVT